MTNYHMHSKEFLVGAAVGSLLGSVAALLAAPKSGRRLRQDICDAYCDFSDKTHDMARKGKSLAKNVSCQTSDWAGKAKSLVQGLTSKAQGWCEEEEEYCTRDLLVGGLVGGIVGAVAGLLLAPKPGEDLRQDIVDTYHDMSEKTQDIAGDMSKKGKSFAKTARSKASKWLDLAQQIIEEITEQAQDKSEELAEQAKRTVKGDRMHDIMDWASLGFRLWQGLKSRH